MNSHALATTAAHASPFFDEVVIVFTHKHVNRAVRSPLSHGKETAARAAAFVNQEKGCLPLVSYLP